MKIIGICGSPRRGNTETLLIEALKGSKGTGAKTELILLREKNIEFCGGCLSCEKTGKCHIDDDMQEIYKNLIESDAIIFGSPTYYNNVTALFKNLIDRTNVFYRNNDLKNKKAAIICVGGMKLNEGSIENAAKQIKIFCEIQGMKVVGKLLASATKSNEISKNKEILNKARNLGVKVVKSIVVK
jgi:multimeric flavodoxin WrbA